MVISPLKQNSSHSLCFVQLNFPRDFNDQILKLVLDTPSDDMKAINQLKTLLMCHFVLAYKKLIGGT